MSMLPSGQALSSSLSLTVTLSAAQGTEPSISDCIEVLLSGRMLWLKGTIFVKIKQNSWNCVDFEKCFNYFTHQPQFPSFLPLFWSLQPPSPNTSIIHSSESSHAESIKPGMFLQQDQAPRHCVSRLSKTFHHREWAPKLSSCTRFLKFLLALT